jgi:glycine dehydrogenase subunit 1
VLVAETVHPHYVEVLRTYTSGLGLDIRIVARGEGGTIEWGSHDADGAAAVVVQSPNYFGLLEDVSAASAAAHSAEALLVSVADPTAMGLLESPGALGADVAVGEGQGLGNPLSFGGPYVGLFATKLGLVRQVPGRIAGETVDADGRRAYVLTLQAREQHIRRAKATSNVCTNQTLMAICATIYLAWLGPEGLRRLGELCVRRTARTAERLGALPGCRIAFSGPRFKEVVLETPLDGRDLAKRLARRGYLTGPALGAHYPGLERSLIVAVTERRTEAEADGLAEAIEKELAEG